MKLAASKLCDSKRFYDQNNKVLRRKKRFLSVAILRQILRGMPKIGGQKNPLKKPLQLGKIAPETPIFDSKWPLWSPVVPKKMRVYVLCNEQSKIYNISKQVEKLNSKGVRKKKILGQKLFLAKFGGGPRILRSKGSLKKTLLLV